MELLYKLLKALYIILCCVLSLELAIVIHELGHFAMGKFIGYKLGYYRIGSFAIAKVDGHWKFTRCDGAFGTRGQCIMIPPKSDHPEKVPSVLYHLGGGLFNILTALISVLFIVLFSHIMVRTLFLLLAAFSLGFAILNLFPMILTVPNDGYNAKLAWKKGADNAAMYRILHIIGLPDLSPSEMPPELYEYSEEGEYSHVSKMMCSYLHLDRKEFDEAEKLLVQCASKDNNDISYYRMESCSELLFCRLLRGAPKKEIESVYNEELKQYFEKTKKTSARVHRVMYAYHHLYEKNEKAARESYEQAKKLQKQNAFKGDAKMEAELLEYASKIEAAS